MDLSNIQVLVGFLGPLHYILQPGYDSGAVELNLFFLHLEKAFKVVDLLDESQRTVKGDPTVYERQL